MNRKDNPHSMRFGCLFFSLYLLQATVAHPLEPGKIGNIDVFGVAPGSITEVERCFSAELREYAAASNTGKREQALELEAKLERQIREAGGFEAVKITLVNYFEPHTPSDLTFDITLAGTKSPVGYLPQPLGDIPDPDGLLASWQEYEKIGSALDFDGQLAESPPCPVHHCVYGFDHPTLRPYGDKFTQKVPVDRDQLIKVLLADKDDKKRGAAAFLLAHLRVGQDVLNALLPRLYDPAPKVRNNIMRVLTYMVEHGEARSIPIEPILPFLASPVLTDRNKAVSIVAALADDKSHRELLIRRSGCALVRLTETKQPNQNQFARTALVKLRGADLGTSDSAAWRKWLQTQGVSCPLESEIGSGKLCPVKGPAPSAKKIPGPRN